MKKRVLQFMFIPGIIAVTCCIMSAEFALSQNAKFVWGELISNEFKESSDCMPVDVCKNLKVGEMLKISGISKIEGKDYAHANTDSGLAVSVLSSYLKLNDPLTMPDPSSGMPVVRPEGEEAKSPIVITPDTETDYK